MPEPSPQEQPVSLLGGILSYLVPGLGQMSQGRFGKGLLFMVCLVGLFHVGQAMGGWKNVYIPNQIPDNRFPQDQPDRGQRLRHLPSNLYQRWHYLGQFWIGVSAWPALWQYFELPLPPPETSRFYHDYQRCPPEHEIGAFWVDSDKTPDLGWIYTVIAGVLNILVIYDAYAGPAFRGDPRKGDPRKDGPQAKPQEGGS